MKRFIRFDSVGGASGDMLLSALVSLGADLEKIRSSIASFFPEPLHFHQESVCKSGICGVHVSIHSEHHHADESQWMESGEHHEHAHEHDHHHVHGHCHRSYADIRKLLETSSLSNWVKGRALDVFRSIAEAEAKIHGKTPDTVHFHEVGAWDSVADIVGVCLALEQLEVAGISCGPLPSGIGTIFCAHGEMPNPAPATQVLLEGMPIVQTNEPHELVTPTGAALLGVLSRTLEKFPTASTVVRSGIGFGSRELEKRPNLLRATLVEATAGVECAEDDILLMETNLDDANPEWLGALSEDLLEAGAKDVWYTPILMKKGRPATELHVLSDSDRAQALRELIFRESGTLGIRYYPVQRETLDRRDVRVQTNIGEASVKIGSKNGEDWVVSPEFSVCRELAKKHGIPLREVYEMVREAYRKEQ